jgi:hypothetical protein
LTRVAKYIWKSATVLALWSSLAASGTASAAQRTEPTIWFGSTAGYPVGLCGRDPAFMAGFSVKIFQGGRVVTWKVSQRYPIPHLTAASVQRLVRRASRDGFFHIPGHLRDVSCSEASTTYIRIQAAGMNHTVDIYGYLDSRHPAFSDLLQAMSRAANL